MTKQKRYQDKWLTDETYFRAMKAQFPSLESLGFDRGSMNRAISVCGGGILDDFTTSNTTGIFRRKTRGVDPFTDQIRMVWGYFVTTPGGLVERPPDGKKSFLSLLQDDKINDRYSVARGFSEVVDLTTEIHMQSNAKRKADTVEAQEEDDKKKAKASCSLHPGSASAKILEESYWDSPEAKKLFLGNSTDDRSVVEVLQQRIERLQQANRTSDGWRDLIDKHDIDNLCSPYDIFIIRQRCSILCLAYITALEEMNSVRWVEDCCSQAIYDCNRMGIEAAATNERTVADWNILLRANCEHFPLPDPKIHKQKKPLPDLLEYFREEITAPWIDYCIGNLADLTVESARNELVTKIIPKYCSQAATDDENEKNGEDIESEHGTTNCISEREDNSGENADQKSQTIKDCLLKAYLDSPISLTTTWRWLRRLGFHYDNRKKSFFVDGHERPNVVCHRNEFCTNYLSKLEPRTHRWIQVTKETVEKWKSEKRISDDAAGQGYAYREQISGEQMIEFHVDDYELLHSVAEEMGFGLFGGNLSVRKPPSMKPLMIFGQDESVFNQFLLKSRQWVGPQGQRPLLPKTDGMSLMLSAFQSRETGFSVHISRIQMEEINDCRRGQNYVDLDAAIAIHGQVSKKDLKESPFVVSFELGANNDGYWTYNHMSIQFEDCVDCVKVLFPQFDFIFLFDHSQGHAKKLTNGLDAYSMNRSYGGAQPIMRESTIKDHDGYLGMHQRTLEVGNTQSFVFRSDDDGPFWMSPQERELNRHNRILAPTPGIPRTRNKTIAELKAELAPLNILNDRRQYRLAELQEIARNNNLDPKTERTRERKGWEGHPKGLMQVLWERGWIDENQIEKYTMDLAKDDDGEVLEGAENWSLKYLMASCLDFAEEMTALQHVGHELGVSVLITPKFHAEMAGEGIEYSWGVAKSVYRRMPLDSKKGKTSFKALVNECTSRDVLTTTTVRKLSRRARSYICAYYAIHQRKQQDNGNDVPSLTLPIIDRIVKAFKTHRAVVDFDTGFVNSIVSSAIEDVLLSKNENEAEV